MRRRSVPLIVKLPAPNRPAGGSKTRCSIGVADDSRSRQGTDPGQPARALAVVALWREHAQASPIYSESLYGRYHFGWGEIATIRTAAIATSAPLV
jgi:hypothetical protein